VIRGRTASLDLARTIKAVDEVEILHGGTVAAILLRAYSGARTSGSQTRRFTPLKGRV
jgi:hypothetical protein